MYPGNRPNLIAASNMQGSTNSANASNFNLGNTTTHVSSGFYMHGRMAAGRFRSSEPMYGQAAVGNFCSHPALNVGSEDEHTPQCGNGIDGLIENTYGRANQFTDGRRGSCKRKSLEGISGHSSYDGLSHSFSWQRGSSSRYIVPERHDMGSTSSSVPVRRDMGGASSFATPVVTHASAQYWEEPVMSRRGLMGGPVMAPDYRSSALSVTGAIEDPQRSVQRRSNPTYHEDQNLPLVQPSCNYGWHVQPTSSPAGQPNMDPAATKASNILHDRCQFPTSSVFQRRNLVLDGRNGNMPTVGSHFSFNAIGMVRSSSLHVETNSSNMIRGIPNQGWPMSDADSRISNNDLSSLVPVTRNLSGILHTAPMCANPVISSRETEPWYPRQSLCMQVPRANSNVAQESLYSSRSGQGSHRSLPSGAISFTPVDMVINPETGLQSSHHLRPSWMEYHSDRNLRPFTRSIQDISLERPQTLQSQDNRHNDIISEDFLLFDPLEFYGVVDLHDRHRDMRLDVDNMTYEELLALGEWIGNVSTGLTEESISKCLKIRTYSSSTKSSAADEALQNCSICQETYEDYEELGTLECGHDHHYECIKTWLLQKNECPICKASALNT